MTPLPRLLVLSDRSMCAGDLVETLAVAVGHGACAIVLREKDLSDVDRRRLADGVRAMGATVILAGRGGDAVHLSASDPFPLPRPPLVGRSCHTPPEVARAAAEGCDYVTVSPVFPTSSKPGYGPPLGPAGLAALVRVAPPVYALGGVLPEHVPRCVAAGAYGVAAMGPIMRDPTMVADYLAALEVPA